MRPGFRVPEIHGLRVPGPCWGSWGRIHPQVDISYELRGWPWSHPWGQSTEGQGLLEGGTLLAECPGSQSCPVWAGVHAHLWMMC